MQALRSYWLRLPTLEDRYSPRNNAFGLIRMALACGVIIAHSRPLGFAQPSVGYGLSAGQSDLGTLSIYGFFLTSGFLITESALRSSLWRYAWARFLRVFPGLWVCLLVTVFFFAPLANLYERGSLDGFWTHPLGPIDYLTTNWSGSMNQFPISGLLAGTPFGRMGGGPSAFDGSLWTLRYDLAFYLTIGALVATGVLRRAPRALLLVGACCYVLILRDLFTAPDWTTRPPARGAVGPIPLLGYLAADWTLYLGFLFLLGAIARLYVHRLPMHGSLAAVAAVVLAGSLWRGGFIAIGPPLCAYLVLYLAVALPKRLARLGRGRDYTYGIYIYGFPVQQTIALLGAARFGAIGYIVLSLLGTLLFAVPSWHLVERHAIRLKNVSLPTRRQPVPGQGYDPARRGPGAIGAVPDATVLDVAVLDVAALDVAVLDDAALDEVEVGAVRADPGGADPVRIDAARTDAARTGAARNDTAEIQEQTRRRA